MLPLIRSLLLASIALWVIGLPAATVEKDGLRVDATFRTLENLDTRFSASYSDVERMMTLRTVIKNTGFKPLPAGTIEWTLVVRRIYYSGPGALAKHSGTIEIKDLKAGEQVEMNLGEVRVDGHRSASSGKRTDELEAWRLVFVHDGQRREIVSSSSFGALEKRAVDRTGR